MVPVTKGTAARVTRKAEQLPSEPRLVMPSPALKPRLANRLAQIRLVERTSTRIARHYRDNPWMTRNGGTAQCALIAGGRYDQHPRTSAWFSASSSIASPLVEGCARHALRLMTRAPA